MTQAARAEFSHLGEKAREALALSDEERVQYIQRNRWIGYQRATKAIAELEALLVHPRSDRMPCKLIVGESNNGKTMIAKRFMKLHPASENPEGDRITAPVLLVNAPPAPDENRFYSNILDAVFAPYRSSDIAGKKYSQVIRTLRNIGTRMLIIDDIHDILAGHLTKQQQMLNAVRLLGKELEMSIVSTGIKTAVRAIQSDIQLRNRFEPIPLPKWQMDDEYLRLLASFERMLPLKRPSALTETSLAAKILGMGEGLLGEIATVLRKAAEHGVRSGAERIDAKVLDKIGWTAPSDRKRVAEGLV